MNDGENIPLFSLTFIESSAAKKTPLTHRAVKPITEFKQPEIFTPRLSHNDIIGKTPNFRFKNKALRKEIIESDRRLRIMKNGGSLKSILSKKPVFHQYEYVEPQNIGIRRSIEQLPVSSSPVKKHVELYMPINPPKQPNLVDTLYKDSTVEKSLQKLIDDERIQNINNHQRLINDLNHMNQRRQKAVFDMYKDSFENGFEVARKNAARRCQKSRLRILRPENWWEEFVEFAFEEKVGPVESKLIDEISQIDYIVGNDYSEMMERAKALGPKGQRSIQLLEWLNDRLKIVDKNIEALISRR